MRIIINNSSMIPIYEQIMNQIKKMISHGDLKINDPLPSVRALAKELKISALTVKKAYDNLEAEGFTTTIHGKGTYVSTVNPDLLLEDTRKEIENLFAKAIVIARQRGISDAEIKDIFELILEE